MSDLFQASLFGDSEPQPSLASPEAAFVDLSDLRTTCLACQKCSLAAERTHVVVERGNPQARVMIIGEGPGQQEDEQGLPFVGKSGQLLDKILQSVQFDPSEDVYICNVVKCRPPNNRVPTTDEIAACTPYLFEQIRLVNPQIILLTGATAMQAILQEKRGITKVRGQWFEWQGRWVMPIFHPAYLLRNPSREPGKPKWLMWQDIQAIKQKWQALASA